MAGRGHHSVPKREEHQLGGRIPRAGDHPLARQDQGGHGLQRDHPAPRLAADIVGRCRRPRHRRDPEEGPQDRRRGVQDPHRRVQPAAVPHRTGGPQPTARVLLLLRRRRSRRDAVRELEDSVPQQRCKGTPGCGPNCSLTPVPAVQPARPYVRRYHLEHVHLVPCGQLLWPPNGDGLHSSTPSGSSAAARAGQLQRRPAVEKLHEFARTDHARLETEHPRHLGATTSVSEPSCHGCSDGLFTPNIDRIADEGMLLPIPMASKAARQAGRRSSPARACTAPV